MRQSPTQCSDLRRHGRRQDNDVEHNVGYIPDGERIVTIEDSAELRLQKPHVVRLENTPANVEGRARLHSATWFEMR